MDKSLSRTQLAQISALITAKMGLHFPEDRWHDLERGLVSSAIAGGFTDAGAYCESLLATSLTHSQIETLSAHLTIGETYFFRGKPAFNALRESILPELIRSRRGSTKQLRIWSAGCCTGEEAYSSAILLRQLIPDLSEWMVTILATDINPQFLHKAVAGSYGEWSFRDVPVNIKSRYFTQTATGRFELLPSIKEQVKFALLNLAEDSYPSHLNNTNAMDVIFCRNVLMYFSPEQAKKVVRNLYHSLAEGGWLVPSLGESSHQLFSDFKIVQFDTAILYQKQSDQATRYAIPKVPQHWQARRLGVTLPAELPRQSMAYPAIGAPVTTSGSPIEPPTEPSTQVEAFLSPQLVIAQRHSKLPKAQSQVFFAQGHYAQAEAQARIELSEQPTDAAALTLLARLCANQGRLGEAAEWCKRSIAADRLNPRCYYLYATIQEELGEIDEAIRSFQRTLYLHPEFVLAHFALGYLARRQGKSRVASKHFENTLRLLQRYQPDEMLPESDGWTAGRLIEMVRLTSVSALKPVSASVSIPNLMAEKLP